MSSPVDVHYIVGPGGTIYGGRVGAAAPTAAFIGTPLSGTVPFATTYTDQSTGSITSWSWDFGDLGTSTSQNPTHANTTPGVYNVSLTVTGPGGSNTLTKTNYVTASPSAGTTLTTLRANSTVTGTVPYSATFLPLQGQVPSGYTVQSPDDATAKASIVSTYSDGSAATVIVSGSVAVTSGTTSNIRLQAGTGTDTPLTAAAISAQVTSVSVAFGAPYGTASITDFSTPERTWWANGNTICARYRVQPSTPGSTALECVIDIHAWSDRALVEIVVENSKFNAATSTTASLPAAASYTAAVVSVNGSTVTTVNGNAAPETNHAPTRAWYASTWVGAGNPNLRIVQDYLDLQKHPLLFKCAEACTFNLATYASDAYTPWSTGRQRPTGMGSTGDSASIGPIPQWEAHFLQSGDGRAANATEASALALLGYNINVRDSVSGLVPDQTLAAGKTQTSSTQNWPHIYGPNDTGTGGDMSYEVAHHPAVGLVAFVCRPSPVYIELAQKSTVWCATWSAESGNLNGWSGTPTWGTDYTGIFGNAYQMRGRAWSMRTLTHATFLSPDGSAWRTGGKVWMARNATYLNGWVVDSKALLNTFWDWAPNDLYDAESGGGVYAGFQNKLWENQYLTTELHKAASVSLLTGSDQTLLSSVADWAALQPVRWVNEQTNGGWRFIMYETTIGSSSTAISSAADWGTQMASVMIDSPSSVSGTIRTSATGTPNSYGSAGGWYDDTAGSYYPSYWWAAFCAGMERQVSGYANAWNTVQANVTNLSTWLTGFGSDPRWGSTPRNSIPATGTPTWVSSISTTQMTEVASSPTYLAGMQSVALPTSGSYLPDTTTALDATRQGFCQYAYDEIGKKFYIWGGGHRNGSCNAVVEFDLYNLSFTQKLAATPPTPCYTDDYIAYFGGASSYSIQYPSGFTDGYFETAPPLTISTDTAKAAPMKAPPSLHAYSAVTYYSGKVQTHYGSTYDADVVAGNWSLLPSGRDLYGPQFTSPFAQNPLSNNTYAFVDTSTGHAWVTFINGDGNDSWRHGLLEVRLSDRTVLNVIGGTSGIGNSGCKVDSQSAIVQVGRKCWVLMYPDVYPGPWTLTAGAIVDMDTRAIEYATFTGDAVTWNSNNQQEMIPVFYNGTNIYMWNYHSDVNALYRISATSSSGTGTTTDPYVYSVTRVALGTSGLPTNDLNGVPNIDLTYRLDYIADWGVVVVFPNSRSKLWALKI